MGGDGTVRMKDIADHLGVSVATVSRALAGKSGPSAEVRQRVCDYARQIDFYPNPAGGMLRLGAGHPQRIIGVIVPQIAHYYFSTILSGVEQAATARGYQVAVAQSNELYSREAAICQQFVRNRLCGVIVSQAKDTSDYAHFCRVADHGMPLVFYDRICTGLSTSRVVVDDYTGAFNAVSHLAATGCRRIAFFTTPHRLEISRNRFNGYRDALARASLPYDPALVVACDNRDLAEQVTPGILSAPDRPDGFFAVNDDTAIGILYAAKRMGLRVPQDVSICGFTNGQRAVACDPQLTTVEQRGFDMGREAARIVMDQCEGLIPKDKPVRSIIRTSLIVRGTTRPAPIS